MSNSLSSRERIRIALNHQIPDRIPLDLGSTIVSSISAIAYEKLITKLGVHDEIQIMDKMQHLAYVGEEVLQYFQIDTRTLRLGQPKTSLETDFPDGTWRDWWGIIRRQSPSHVTEYWDLFKSPLAGEYQIDDLERYPWPDPYDQGMYEDLRGKATAVRNANYAVVFDSNCFPMTICQFLRGWEEWFSDFALRPQFIKALMGKVVEIQVNIVKQALSKVGGLIDIFVFGDDLGVQDGPMFSPTKYRELIKPGHKKIVEAVKKYTSAKVMFHNCGSIVEFIPDMIDIGIDILNPIQVSAKGMNTKKLKKRFDRYICFWGGIDTQNVLPYGSQRKVREEAKRRIGDLGKNGGYVLAPSHNIQADVDPDNIIAMYQAGLEYGKYT